MSRAGDDIRDIAVVGQDSRQSLDDGFNSLVWRQQAEGQQYELTPNSEPVLVKIWIHKRKVRDSMWDDVNSGRWNPVDLPQELRRVLTHHNQPVRQFCDFQHHPTLVGVRFFQHSVQSGHYRHAEFPQQIHNVAACRPTENSVLMLHTHQIDIGEIEKLRCTVVGQLLLLSQLESHAFGIAVFRIRIIHRQRK